MFDGLLYGKFSKNCKHCVKCINSRLLLIKNKTQATVKILKKDVADLLANGHDSNAFGRMERLIVEMNHAWCYDMIEYYCRCILNLLPSLQKQRECPEEAMEAISTLVFAAARFSDLPELDDLRRAFTEKYGSHMDSSINLLFVEKWRQKSFSTDEKLLLMKNIAEEFSVRWEFRAFQQNMFNSSPIASGNGRLSSNKNEERSTIDLKRDERREYEFKHKKGKMVGALSIEEKDEHRRSNAMHCEESDEEEEEAMDRLLNHLSKKGRSNKPSRMRSTLSNGLNTGLNTKCPVSDDNLVARFFALKSRGVE